MLGRGGCLRAQRLLSTGGEGVSLPPAPMDEQAHAERSRPLAAPELRGFPLLYTQPLRLIAWPAGCLKLLPRLSLWPCALAGRYLLLTEDICQLRQQWPRKLIWSLSGPRQK